MSVRRGLAATSRARAGLHAGVVNGIGRVGTVGLVAFTACSIACGTGGGSVDDVDAVSFATPRALACAQAPALEARLWVSGSAVPCGLTVNDDGTTSGSCDARPGRKRTLTLDWFVHDDAHAVDLILAQARGTIDLANEKDAQVPFTVKESDIKTTDCLDVSVDQVSGKATIVVDGVDVPVCDVDNSCNGADGGCTNLGELCGGGDPFDPAVDP